jgi:E3 ubiquitin-protein transferase RMND5
MFYLNPLSPWPLITTAEDDAHKISIAMTTLQNPVKSRFEAITEDLKDVTKAQRGFGKALDKVGPCLSATIITAG